MTIFRKILFYVFVLVYITVCPMLIMNSLGIIFKPTTQSIERTGVIYLSTIPSEAKVYINRKYFDDTTPALISGLLRGNYHVRLVREGYRDWHKFLPVEEQRSTSLENILLVPEQWSKEALGGAYEELIPIGRSPFLLLRKGPLLKDVEIFRETASANVISEQETPSETPSTEDNPAALVFDGDPLAQAQVLKITAMEESPHVLLQIKQDHRRRNFWVKLEAKPPELLDISHLVPEDVPDIRWSKDHPAYLYFLKDHSLHFIDLDQARTAPILTGVASFAIHNGHLFVLTEEKVLKRFDREGKNEAVILDDPQIIKKLFEPAKTVEMHLFKDNLMVFLTEKGSLLMNQLPHLFIEEGVRGFDYRQEDKRLVFWDRRDIGTIDINLDSNETIFQIGPQVRWLGLQTDNVQQAFFVNEGRNIVFRNGDTVFLTEEQNFGQPVINEVAKIRKNSAVAFNNHESALFFLDEEKGQFSMIKLGAKTFVNPLTGNN